MHTIGSPVARRRRQIDSCLAIKVFHVGVYLDAIIICAVIGPAVVKQPRRMIFIRTYRVSVDSITKCTRKRKIVAARGGSSFYFCPPGRNKALATLVNCNFKSQPEHSRTQRERSSIFLDFPPSNFSTALGSYLIFRSIVRRDRLCIASRQQRGLLKLQLFMPIS